MSVPHPLRFQNYFRYSLYHSWCFSVDLSSFGEITVIFRQGQIPRMGLQNFFVRKHFLLSNLASHLFACL